MPMTITEALAEIKTIGKRITAKREYVQTYLYRQEGMKDPLQNDGGSITVIERERQAISDLEQRIVDLRRGIQLANEQTEVTINGFTHSIADWLTWRRDVAPERQRFLSQLRQKLMAVREAAKRTGSNVLAGAAAIVQTDNKPTDWVVNINEADLAKEIERLEETLGILDGQLSLKNATVSIRE